MIAKDYFNKVTNSGEDFLQAFIDLLEKRKIAFCVIGGLAVNVYAEPVVSLDLDVVIVADKIDELLAALPGHFNIARYANSINITESASDLRIQIQTDSRYQHFISKASYKNVLGYKLSVAAVEDVLQGKIWAALDKGRRPSKRQKDLADILRLVEVHNHLISLIPETLRKKLDI